MMIGTIGSSSMWGMCVMMGVFGLFFIVVAGLTVYWVTRSSIRGCKVEDRSLMILKERYARGEIEEEEYNEKRKRLNWK